MTNMSVCVCVCMVNISIPLRPVPSRGNNTGSTTRQANIMALFIRQHMTQENTFLLFCRDSRMAPSIIITQTGPLYYLIIKCCKRILCLESTSPCPLILRLSYPWSWLLSVGQNPQKICRSTKSSKGFGGWIQIPGRKVEGSQRFP